MTNDECRTTIGRRCRAGRDLLLHDLERGSLSVACRRAGQQRADCLNGLAIPANDSAHVRLTQLHSEDCCLPRRNLGKHHLIRKFNELSNDELKKLFHD